MAIVKENFPVIVFDIGGTWFRFGLYSINNRLISSSKTKAINYLNTPHKTALELQKKYSDLNLKNVSISMGAALNAHNGLILNSGPLWGPQCKPFNLKFYLEKLYRSHTYWTFQLLANNLSGGF